MLYDAISKGRVYKNQSVINYPTGAKKKFLGTLLRKITVNSQLSVLQAGKNRSNSLIIQ